MFKYIVLISLSFFVLSCGSDSAENQEIKDDTIVQIDSIQAETQYITVMISQLRLREHPTLKGKILDNIPEKTKVEFLNETTDYKDKIKIRGTQYNEHWYKVSYEGKIGWVYGGGVSMRKEEVVKKGLSLRLDEDKIQFNGMKLKDTKIRLSKVMGQPDSIIEPKFDCGPFSEDWQKKKFFQHFYKEMNFIVYENIAEIQDVDFSNGLEMSINGIVLNGEMDLKTVATMLGLNPSDAKNNRIIIYPNRQTKDYFYLEFRNGYLYRFDRNEPC